MASGKTTTLTFRIAPIFKDALRIAAEREHRSIANMIEVLIRDHCNRAGIAIAGSTICDSGVSSGNDSEARAANTTRSSGGRKKVMKDIRNTGSER